MQAQSSEDDFLKLATWILLSWSITRKTHSHQARANCPI